MRSIAKKAARHSNSFSTRYKDIDMIGYSIVLLTIYRRMFRKRGFIRGRPSLLCQGYQVLASKSLILDYSWLNVAVNID